MPTLLVLVGLPGSGKSTWARRLISGKPSWKRVNRDDLRAMLDDSRYSSTNELHIRAIRDTIIRETLAAGYNIVVDDTNLGAGDVEHFQNLAEEIDETLPRVEIMSFTDIPVEECIRRDSLRPKPVGEGVIRGMWERYQIRCLEHNLV